MREFLRKYSPIVLLTLWVVLSFFVTVPWQAPAASEEQPVYHKVLLQSSPSEKPKTYAYDAILLDSIGTFHLPKRVTLYLGKDSSALFEPGDVLVVRTALADDRGFVNWGEWGWVEHRELKDISVLQGKLRIPATRCRDYLEGVLHSYHLPQEEEALIMSLVLGDRRSMSLDQKEAFADAGAMHVLAVSGLHVGLLRDILMLLLTVGGLLTIPRTRPGLMWLQRILILFLLWSYAFLTGLSTSVLRSVIMFSLLPIYPVSDVRPIRFNRLAAAALLILIMSPNALYSPGFLLSFSAVLALMYYLPRWNRWMPHFGRYFSSLILASLAAQIGTLPWTLLFFGQTSNYFLLTNVIVIPLATILLAAVLVALPLACLWGASAVTKMLMSVCGTLAEWMNQSVGWVQSLPGATSVYDLPPIFALLLVLFIISLTSAAYFSTEEEVPHQKRRRTIALLLSTMLSVAMLIVYACHLR